MHFSIARKMGLTRIFKKLFGCCLGLPDDDEDEMLKKGVGEKVNACREPKTVTGAKNTKDAKDIVDVPVPAEVSTKLSQGNIGQSKMPGLVATILRPAEGQKFLLQKDIEKSRGEARDTSSASGNLAGEKLRMPGAEILRKMSQFSAPDTIGEEETLNQDPASEGGVRGFSFSEVARIANTGDLGSRKGLFARPVNASGRRYSSPAFIARNISSDTCRCINVELETRGANAERTPTNDQELLSVAPLHHVEQKIELFELVSHKSSHGDDKKLLKNIVRECRGAIDIKCRNTKRGLKEKIKWSRRERCSAP